jgi:hypothetical protein
MLLPERTLSSASTLPDKSKLMMTARSKSSMAAPLGFNVACKRRRWQAGSPLGWQSPMHANHARRVSLLWLARHRRSIAGHLPPPTVVPCCCGNVEMLPDLWVIAANRMLLESESMCSALPWERDGKGH